MRRGSPPECLAERTVECAITDLACADSHRGFRFEDDQGAEHLVSFPAMELETARVAAALQDLGARPGDRLVLILGRGHAFVTTFLGAIRAGLIPAPLSPPFGLGRLTEYVDGVAHVVAQSGASWLVTEPRIETLLAPVAQRFPRLVIATPSALQGGGAFRPRHRSLSDVCFLQFTSGSTARPRGVIVRDRNVTANARALTLALGDLGLELEVDQAVTWLPLHHDMGLMGGVLLPLYTHNPVVVLTPLSFLKRPRRWLEAISRHRASISFAPNFAYALCARRLQPQDLEGLDLSRWRVAGCGAEPIHGRDLDDFARLLAPAGFDARALTCAYGLAEATVAVSFSRRGAGVQVDAVDAEALAVRGRAVPAAPGALAVEVVSCGEPLDGLAVAAFAPDDATSARPLAEREVGELRVRGASVTSGYYADEDASAARLAGEWLRTGDLGYLADGCVYVCGRLKDVLIVHGRNLFPHDLEWAAATVAGVHNGRVVAFATHDAHGREEVVIALETALASPDDRARLARDVTRRVFDGCGVTVAAVVTLARDTLPRTSSGKPQRYRVRELHARGALAASPAITAPPGAGSDGPAGAKPGRPLD
jgi:fatty-acyl-CoA synthase